MSFEINVIESKIDGGMLNNAVIGDNNQTAYGNYNDAYSNYEIPKDFSKYLKKVKKNSNSRKERKCAAKANKLYKKNNFKSLREYIIDNINTFMTGTFATTAGGMLLEIIRNITK